MYSDFFWKLNIYQQLEEELREMGEFEILYDGRHSQVNYDHSPYTLILALRYLRYAKAFNAKKD